MNNIDYWHLEDRLSIIQATLLILDIDPTKLQYEVEHSDDQPDGYVATKHALITCVQSKVEGLEPVYTQDELSGEFFFDLYETRVDVTWLKKWLQERGFKPSFFFPKETQDEFLDKNHARYSPKLAAAVCAWRALDDSSLIEKTPKQSIMSWLKKNSDEFNLKHPDGHLKKGVIEDIAKVVNWNPEGGAPTTPYGSG